MSIKKPYIQIHKTDINYSYWKLMSSNGVKIAHSQKVWYDMKPCRASAHRAGVTLGLEVRNEK